MPKKFLPVLCLLLMTSCQVGELYRTKGNFTRFDHFSLINENEACFYFESDEGNGFYYAEDVFSDLSDADQIVVSKDKSAFAIISTDMQSVILNGEEISGEDFISDVVLSPNGSRYAVLFTNESGACTVQTEDGVIGSYAAAEDPTFSDDSSIFYFLHADGGVWEINVNGEDFFCEKDQIVHFSPDGSAYAYGYYSNWREHANLNGDVFSGHTTVETPSLSDGGKAMGFAYVDGGSYYGKYFVYVDGYVEGSFEEARSPVFSRDGFKSAYVYREIGEEDYFIQQHNKVFGPYEDVGELIFSDDGSAFAFTYFEDGQKFLYNNGNINTASESLLEFGYSPDGSHFYRINESSSGFTLTIDENFYGIYDEIGTLSFTNDFYEFVFSYQKDGESAIVSDLSEITVPGNLLEFEVFENNCAVRYENEEGQWIKLGEELYGPFEISDMLITENAVSVLYPKKNKILIRKLDI